MESGGRGDDEEQVEEVEKVKKVKEEQELLLMWAEQVSRCVPQCVRGPEPGGGRETSEGEPRQSRGDSGQINNNTMVSLPLWLASVRCFHFSSADIKHPSSEDVPAG